jgi:hypothetical protein
MAIQDLRITEDHAEAILHQDSWTARWLACRTCRLTCWKESCLTNTIAGAVTKTHSSARESAAATTREPVTSVACEWRCPESGH